MCKKDNKAVMPGEQENNNVNVGLNMSSEKFGENISGEAVVTYIIAAICIFMCFKRLKKCWNRRQEKQRDMIRNLSQRPMINLDQGRQQQLPMQQIPAQQQLALPALPAPLPVIVHPNQFKLPVLDGTEDRMEKYRT